jgi:hypothetical protein
MNEPVWLKIEAIQAIQMRLLAQFGGLAGLRDEGSAGVRAASSATAASRMASPTCF